MEQLGPGAAPELVDLLGTVRVLPVGRGQADLRPDQRADRVEAVTGAGDRRPGDHSGKVTRVRIICDDLSHARTLVDIASFKRTPSAGGEGVGSWEEYWNDSPFAPEEELDQGRPHEVPLAPKRVVRDAERTSDVFECPKCRRRLLINRNDMDARLERLHLAGMSHLSFPDLVATMTK